MSYQPPGGPPPPPQGWQQPPAGAPYPASAYPTAPGYGYPPATKTRSVKGLATAITVLLALTGVVALIAAISFFHRASVYSDFQDRAAFFPDVHDADNQAAAFVGLLQFGLLATGIVWIVWQFRFAKNAELLRGSYGLAPGWAIGGWFIPLGNLVLPQLQLMQAAKASDPDLPAGQPAARGRVPSTLPVWWILYDLAGVMFAIGSVTRSGENTLLDIDRTIRGDRVSAFACLVYVAAAVVAILVVRGVTERQALALERVGPQQPQWPQQPYGAAPYGVPQYGQQPQYGAPPTYPAPPPAYPAPPPPPAPPLPAPPAAPPPQQWPPPPPPPPQ